MPRATVFSVLQENVKCVAGAANQPLPAYYWMSASPVDDQGHLQGVVAVNGVVQQPGEDPSALAVTRDSRVRILTTWRLEEVGYYAALFGGGPILLLDGKRKPVAHIDRIDRTAVGIRGIEMVHAYLPNSTAKELQALMLNLGCTDAIQMATGNPVLACNGTLVYGAPPVATLIGADQARTELSVAGPPLVILDPAHGGNEPGGRFGELSEKQLNLTAAEEAYSYLSEYEVMVMLTRYEDITVPLPDRVEAASVLGADLFVSIHHNIEDGFGSYTYGGAVDASAQYQKVIHGVVVESCRIPNRGVQRGNLYTLRNAGVPSVLLEGSPTPNFGAAIGRGIVQALSLPRRKVLRLVRVEVAVSAEEAVVLRDRLRAEGFEAWIKA